MACRLGWRLHSLGRSESESWRAFQNHTGASYLIADFIDVEPAPGLLPLHPSLASSQGIVSIVGASFHSRRRGISPRCCHCTHGP